MEAISPTLPPDPVKEDTTLKTVKDELIGKIGKVDKDIASTETWVNELKEKEVGHYQIIIIAMIVILLFLEKLPKRQLPKGGCFR